MKISITGGTGFIGRKLVKHLSENGHQLRVLTRKINVYTNYSYSENISYINGDLIEDFNLNEFIGDSEILIHCAAELKNESIMNSLHVDGTRNLINAAAGKIKKWIQLSSAGAYGQPMNGLINEESTPNPNGVYEVSKVESDKLVENAQKENLFQTIILRPSVVFGSDMPNQSLFSLIKTLQSGYFTFIGEVGSSANYIHVNNVVHAINLCVHCNRSINGIFILNHHSTWENFIFCLCDNLGIPRVSRRFPIFYFKTLLLFKFLIPFIPLSSTRLNALTTKVIYDSNKIYSVLGYSPILSFEQAISEFVNGSIE